MIIKSISKFITNPDIAMLVAAVSARFAIGEPLLRPADGSFDRYARTFAKKRLLRHSGVSLASQAQALNSDHTEVKTDLNLLSFLGRSIHVSRTNSVKYFLLRIARIVTFAGNDNQRPD